MLALFRWDELAGKGLRTGGNAVDDPALLGPGTDHAGPSFHKGHRGAVKGILFSPSRATLMTSSSLKEWPFNSITEDSMKDHPRDVFKTFPPTEYIVNHDLTIPKGFYSEGMPRHRKDGFSPSGAIPFYEKCSTGGAEGILPAWQVPGMTW